MTYPMTVVCDLDGTLAHTSPDIAVALNAALAPFGKQVSLAETERMVGGGLRLLLDKALRLTSLDLPPADVEAVFGRLGAHYRASPAAMSSLHGWVAETMRALHDEGARIAVCSNKPEDICQPILEALGAMSWLDAVVGHVEGRKKKPDPEPLLLAISAAGGDLSRAVMIGNSAADVSAARAAGIPVILVPHGYGSDDIRTLDADRIVSDRQNLRDAIDELASAFRGSAR